MTHLRKNAHRHQWAAPAIALVLLLLADAGEVFTRLSSAPDDDVTLRNPSNTLRKMGNSETSGSDPAQTWSRLVFK